ncbi:nucleoside phosphorylase domain-containing protein [Aspergillus ambiguus]|uniref:nucleoside phosphorylase domain-containing protein n=1 Tax=Aspergillus ambiguus TaxID=176160 RepID=UPI003CCD0E3A
MQAKPKCPPLGKFTVGWIAALHCEYLAAKQVLDVEYTPPAFYVSKGSGNVYTFGRIGEHHVVIATLGRYGTLPAVAVLNGLQNRFPFLQFVLMVGVAGGVPTGGDDIRLGDVVVANQMVPYSVNKKYPNAAQFNGVIVLPGEDFLSAAAKVRVMIEGGEVDLENIITEKFAKNERIRDRFRRPEDRSDRLYQPGYEHTSDCDCDCLQDESRVPAVLVTRPERKPYDRIRVHCGAIGSADCVVRDAIERDRLARQFKLLCFEMESAGLMANFPCLPIRGICDYSDSHKNKGWQGYAAAVAAAFALSLLHVVPHQDWQAAGHHIDAEALRQHMEQVFESVMHVMSPPGDGETLTLEGARQALDEIRDTVDKLDQLSESRTQELRETTQSAMGKSAAEIDQAKSRLNQIEVEQKHMRELLEELRGKIAQQHEKSPQEEREKWNTVHSEAQKNSTWLKERSESTTAALESTAGILSHVGELTNNTDITRTGRQVNGATGIARRVIDGVERVTKKWGGNRASPSTASPKANSATKHQCVRKEAPVRRLPPPFAAQFAQKPSHACLGAYLETRVPARVTPTTAAFLTGVSSTSRYSHTRLTVASFTVTELYQEQIQRDLDPTTFVVVIVRTLLTPSLEGPTFNSRKVSPSIRRASRTAKTTSQTRPS